jgi:hypothetical protein
MRRILLVLFSTVLLGVGIYVIWLALRCMSGFVPGVCHVMGIEVMAGAGMTALGGYLLWDEFFSQWLTKR